MKTESIQSEYLCDIIWSYEKDNNRGMEEALEMLKNREPDQSAA